MESEFDNVLHRHLDDAVQNVVWRCIYHLSDKTINLTKFLTMNRFNVRKPLLSVVMLCAMALLGVKTIRRQAAGNHTIRLSPSN